MEFKGMLCLKRKNVIILLQVADSASSVTNCVVLQLPGKTWRLWLEAFSDLGKVIQKKSEITFKTTKLDLKSEGRQSCFCSYLVMNDLNINLKLFVGEIFKIWQII